MTLSRRNLLQLLGLTTAAAVLRNAPAASTPGATETESAAPLLPSRITPLEPFLKTRGIKPAHLARESGYSRQHVLHVRLGRIEPTLACIAAIVIAARRLCGERIFPQELFEAHVIHAAWRDAHQHVIEDHERADIRAVFGRHATRMLNGVPA